MLKRAAAVIAAAAGNNARPSRRLADTVASDVFDDIYRCSFKRQTGVSLKYMMDFGSMPTKRNLLLSAQFLHKELPIRLAHRVTELENLPLGLSHKPPILKVRDWYVESFQDLRRFPEIETFEDELEFTQLIDKIRWRHRHVVPVMATGIAQLRKELEQSREYDWDNVPEIHQFLDGFYLSRIGIRMLIGQHVALHQPNHAKNYVGLVCTRLKPKEIAEDAIADARDVCIRHFGSAPEVHMYGDIDLTFAYVPGHLHQMLFELLKNSLRAVQDRFNNSEQEPPPVRLIIAEGGEDVTLKISDEGGGIPRSGLARIWTYLYTTAKNPPIDEDFDIEENGPIVMAGFGYGLPISRLYARYFGGSLQIMSMENYGTDAYLHLNRLGNVQEPLP